MRISIALAGITIPYVSGSCSEEERQLWRNNIDFSKRMDSYARRALGNGDYVTTKLLEDYHPNLSLRCAACHGGTVSCGTKNCWIQCLFSSTALGCQECTRRECLASYMQCVGTETEDDLPPKPQEGSTTTTTPIPVRTRLVRTSTTTAIPTTSSEPTTTTLSESESGELVIP